MRSSSKASRGTPPSGARASVHATSLSTPKTIVLPSLSPIPEYDRIHTIDYWMDASRKLSDDVVALTQEMNKYRSKYKTLKLVAKGTIDHLKSQVATKDEELARLEQKNISLDSSAGYRFRKDELSFTDSPSLISRPEQFADGSFELAARIILLETQLAARETDVKVARDMIMQLEDENAALRGQMDRCSQNLCESEEAHSWQPSGTMMDQSSMTENVMQSSDEQMSVSSRRCEDHESSLRMELHICQQELKYLYEEIHSLQQKCTPVTEVHSSHGRESASQTECIESVSLAISAVPEVASTVSGSGESEAASFMPILPASSHMASQTECLEQASVAISAVPEVASTLSGSGESEAASCMRMLPASLHTASQTECLEHASLAISAVPEVVSTLCGSGEAEDSGCMPLLSENGYRAVDDPNDGFLLLEVERQMSCKLFTEMVLRHIQLMNTCPEQVCETVTSLVSGRNDVQLHRLEVLQQVEFRTGAHDCHDPSSSDLSATPMSGHGDGPALSLNAKTVSVSRKNWPCCWESPRNGDPRALEISVYDVSVRHICEIAILRGLLQIATEDNDLRETLLQSRGVPPASRADAQVGTYELELATTGTITDSSTSAEDMDQCFSAGYVSCFVSRVLSRMELSGPETYTSWNDWTAAYDDDAPLHRKPHQCVSEISNFDVGTVKLEDSFYDDVLPEYETEVCRRIVETSVLRGLLALREEAEVGAMDHALCIASSAKYVAASEFDNQLETEYLLLWTRKVLSTMVVNALMASEENALPVPLRQEVGRMTMNGLHGDELESLDFHLQQASMYQALVEDAISELETNVDAANAQRESFDECLTRKVVERICTESIFRGLLVVANEHGNAPSSSLCSRFWASETTTESSSQTDANSAAADLDISAEASRICETAVLRGLLLVAQDVPQRVHQSTGTDFTCRCDELDALADTFAIERVRLLAETWILKGLLAVSDEECSVCSTSADMVQVRSLIEDRDHGVSVVAPTTQSYTTSEGTTEDPCCQLAASICECAILRALLCIACEDCSPHVSDVLTLRCDAKTETDNDWLLEERVGSLYYCCMHNALISLDKETPGNLRNCLAKDKATQCEYASNSAGANVATCMDEQDSGVLNSYAVVLSLDLQKRFTALKHSYQLLRSGVDTDVSAMFTYGLQVTADCSRWMADIQKERDWLRIMSDLDQDTIKDLEGRLAAASQQVLEERMQLQLQSDESQRALERMGYQVKMLETDKAQLTTEIRQLKSRIRSEQMTSST